MLAMVVDCFWLETHTVNCSKMILLSCLRMAQGGPVVFAHHEKELSVRVCSCLVETAGILMQQIKGLRFEDSD
jgi:hypothetical protein